jgi:hypothetical protein
MTIRLFLILLSLLSQLHMLLKRKQRYGISDDGAGLDFNGKST